MSGREGKTFLTNALTLELDPEEVEVGERIGFLHEDKAAALGRLMAVDGQRDPIKVVANKAGRKAPYRLVTGAHRLHGARLEGIGVWAIEVFGKAEELTDLEASENLHRRPLAPIERAKFVAALCQAAQERIARESGGLKQQKLAIRARWERVKGGEARVEEALAEESTDTSDNMSRVYGWAESASGALGLDKRTIFRSLELFRLVIEPFPDLAEALSRHPVVGENGAQLKLIAQVRDEKSRRWVIEQLIADPEIGADDARIAAGVDRPAGPTPLPHQKHLNAIDGAWSRLGVGHKREFLPRFVQQLTPDLKKRLRELLDEEDA